MVRTMLSKEVLQYYTWWDGPSKKMVRTMLSKEVLQYYRWWDGPRTKMVRTMLSKEVLQYYMWWDGPSTKMVRTMLSKEEGFPRLLLPWIDLSEAMGGRGAGVAVASVGADHCTGRDRLGGGE